jgi:hypothetical protein
VAHVVECLLSKFGCEIYRSDITAKVFYSFVRAVGFLGGTPGCLGTHHEQVPETDVTVNGC